MNTMNDAPDEEQTTATLAEVIQPLIDLLNHSYPSMVEVYEVAPYGRFGSEDGPDNEV